MALPPLPVEAFSKAKAGKEEGHRLQLLPLASGLVDRSIRGTLGIALLYAPPPGISVYRERKSGARTW